MKIDARRQVSLAQVIVTARRLIQRFDEPAAVQAIYVQAIADLVSELAGLEDGDDLRQMRRLLTRQFAPDSNMMAALELEAGFTQEADEESGRLRQWLFDVPVTSDHGPPPHRHDADGEPCL